MAEGFNLCRLQRAALGRHDVVVISRERDALEQQAPSRVALGQGGAGLTAFFREAKLIQSQVAFLFIRTVTLDAVYLEQRLNVGGELHRLGGRRQRGSKPGGGEDESNRFHGVTVMFGRGVPRRVPWR